MVRKSQLIHLSVAGLLATGPALAQPAQTSQNAQTAQAAQSGQAVQSAQTAQGGQPVQSAAPADGRLEEIVVTASKRETFEQRTPIAMTVATGEELARNGINDINAITNIAPTLQIAQNNANTLVTIRGVSSQNFTETGDPAVAISIDNFYLQRAFSVNAALFDIERIEALRGPQGTLYGRNATAGALNIQTVKPSREFGANASLELGSYSLVRAEGAVNVPVSNTLSMRVAGTFRDRDGYRNNAPLKGGDDEDAKGGRLHLLWEPNEQLSVLLTGEIIRLGGVGPVIKRIPTNDLNADGTLRIGSDTAWPLNNQSFTNIDSDAVRAQISWDFGPAKLSYFGGFQRSNLKRDNDQDGGIASNLGFAPNEGLRDQNHELRLSSTDDGNYRWQLGTYYFRQRNDLLTYFQLRGVGPNPINLFIFDYDIGNESKAAFAQGAYSITPEVEVELGIRYSEDERFQIGRLVQGAAVTNVNNRVKDSQVTWLAGVNWQVTDDSLIYGKISKGYKAGGFTTASNYGPETVVAYEIGSKNRFLDDTVQVNASAFYYDYKDLQVNQIDPNRAAQLTLNAGAAEIKGVEIETVWLPTPKARIDASLAWLDTEFTQFCTVTTSPCPAANNRAGNELTQAPDLALTLGLQYTFDVFGGELTPRLQTRYQSKSWFTIANSRAEMQKSYTKTDVLVTYERPDSPWSLTVYGRNLENSTILSGAGFAGFANGYLLQFSAPRTFGARLQVRL